MKNQTKEFIEKFCKNCFYCDSRIGKFYYPYSVSISVNRLSSLSINNDFFIYCDKCNFSISSMIDLSNINKGNMKVIYLCEGKQKNIIGSINVDKQIIKIGDALEKLDNFDMLSFNYKKIVDMSIFC